MTSKMKHWQVTVVPWSWTQRFCFLFIYILLGVFYYIFQKSMFETYILGSLWIGFLDVLVSYTVVLPA